MTYRRAARAAGCASVIVACAAFAAACAGGGLRPRSAAEVARAEAEIARVLDDWHDAAAQADEPRYFGHFARDGVFLGTDATERWDVTAFRAYAHPHFAKKKAWSFHATTRHVVVAPAGNIAWFDEALETANLGPARGSGVVVWDEGAATGAPTRASGRWRIAQYNLTVTVPNERFGEVKALLSAPAAAPTPLAAP